MLATTLTPACRSAMPLFHHPLVEGETIPKTAAQSRKAAGLIAEAKEICLGCPLVQQCLFDAVVRHEVAGVAGGTDPTERQRLRTRLGLVLAEEESAIDGRLPSGTLDPRVVLAARRANPKEPLETLAEKFGCSLSTIKRTLRKARVLAAPPPRPPLPSPEVVWHYFHGEHRRAA